MTLSVQQWHKRYLQQAGWTHDLRRYIYDRIAVTRTQRILDAGCGTGVLLDEISLLTAATCIGLDLGNEPLAFHRVHHPSTALTQADVLQLPFSRRSFDVTLCHFALLWVGQPLRALQEMARVTTPGGYVVALAEPDYGGRIDYPIELERVGAWQMESLRKQGADPLMGRQLRGLFADAGLIHIEAGVMGGIWRADDPLGASLEWDVTSSDLSLNPEFTVQRDRLAEIEAISRVKQERILFVPTFYAIGQVAG